MAFDNKSQASRERGKQANYYVPSMAASSSSRPQQLVPADDDDWADQDFNLIDYIGKDLSPVVEAQGCNFGEPLPLGGDEDEDGMQKETRDEAVYQTMQMQNALYSDYQQEAAMLSPSMDPLVGGGGDSGGGLATLDGEPKVFDQFPALSVPGTSSSSSSLVHHDHNYHASAIAPPKPTTYIRAVERKVARGMGRTNYVSEEDSSLPDEPYGALTAEELVPFEFQHQPKPSQSQKLLRSRTKRIKEEEKQPGDEDEQQLRDNASALLQLGRAGADGMGEEETAIIRSEKTRKYRVKSEVEKRNPVYKQKRAKNNDAVRRSRDKAKVRQVQKEQRLEFLEAELADKTAKVGQLESRVDICNHTIRGLLEASNKLEKQLEAAKKELSDFKSGCTCRRFRR